MTREDIECIIKWFSHIEQLATDGKTANGFQMSTDKILATIKVVAKDSLEYVEKFCNDSVPKDLEEAAIEYSAIGYSPFDDPYEKHQEFECSKFGFIAGAKWQRDQMMKDAVKTVVSLDAGGFPFIEFGVGRFGLKVKDKVKVIIVKED